MIPEIRSPIRLYPAAWRWHPDAGPSVIPFLVMLAVTGLIMLGVASIAGLNGDGAIVVHGTFLIGKTGNWLVEAAAILALLLTVTGIYLHWPRNGRGWRKGLTVQTVAKSRAFWKSLLVAVEVWVSLLLVLFLISGLSWAGLWGTKSVRAWNTFPAEEWDAVALSDATRAKMNHGDAKVVPWMSEQTLLPLPGSLARTTAITGAVTIDSVTRFAANVGFAARLYVDSRVQLNLPADEDGVWTISHASMSPDGPDPSADRTIPIDQFTGDAQPDVRYAEYLFYAMAMAWGIAFHKGDLEVWNLALNTAVCLAIILMSVSGAVMSVKRPSTGKRLAVPPRPANVPHAKGAILITLALSFAIPMLALTMLAFMVLDLVIRSAVPPLKRLVN